MYYKPHTLQKKSHVIVRDAYGRITSDTEGWEDVGVCRCDDNTQQLFETENGTVYRPKYHIVAENDVPVHAGDEVRCIIKGDDGQVTIRGEGKVYQTKHLNFLHYTDIWV